MRKTSCLTVKILPQLKQERIDLERQLLEAKVRENRIRACARERCHHVDRLSFDGMHGSCVSPLTGRAYTGSCFLCFSERCVQAAAGNHESRKTILAGESMQKKSNMLVRLL